MKKLISEESEGCSYVSHIQKFQYIERHFKSKVFSDCITGYRKVGKSLAIALKGKVLKTVKEKVFSTCGRGHFVND